MERAITDPAGGDVGDIANAMEGEFVDHQARDDPGLAGALQVDLGGQQILLADQECEQPDLQPAEMVVNIAQPFIPVVVVTLDLVAKQDPGAATGPGAGFLDLVDQPEALGRIRSVVAIRIVHRFQQIREERALGVAWRGLCSACAWYVVILGYVSAGSSRKYSMDRVSPMREAP